MAKIRIYELARELNMKNKALLDKMAEMGISARSHMSSLEDETVAQIKRSLFGKKAAAVEVTRVRPTVIRRRKREVEKPEQEATAAPEAPSEEITAVEAEAPAVESVTSQPAPEETEAVEPPVVSPQPAAPVVEAPVPEVSPPRRGIAAPRSPRHAHSRRAAPDTRHPGRSPDDRNPGAGAPCG